MAEIALILTALLFGGMTFYSFGFAPVLFRQLPMEQVRPLLRGTFPYYYLAVIGLGLVATAASFGTDRLAGLLLRTIVASTLYARQVLMHQINAATDRGDKAAFARLHGLSVAIQIAQIGLAVWALLRLSS
jgi:hypothetical protein